jgi:hypothetical protein
MKVGDLVSINPYGINNTYVGTITRILYSDVVKQDVVYADWKTTLLDGTVEVVHNIGFPIYAVRYVRTPVKLDYDEIKPMWLLDRDNLMSFISDRLAIDGLMWRATQEVFVNVRKDRAEDYYTKGIINNLKVHKTLSNQVVYHVLCFLAGEYPNEVLEGNYYIDYCSEP